MPPFNLPPYRESTLKEPQLYQFIKSTNLLIADNNTLYTYIEESGNWCRLSDSEARICLLSAIRPDKRGEVSMSMIENIVRRLKSDPDVIVPMEKFKAKNADKINVIDRVIDLATGKSYKHKRGYYFDYCLGFEYKKDSDITSTSSFMQFARTSLDYDTNPAKTQRLLEIMGYTISSLTGAEKCFMLVGPSNCGKSVILNLLEAVIGESNTTNIPINHLADRFSLAELSNSMVNISREMGGKLKNLDIFKSIVSNERISGEFKHGSTFSFTCRCKLLFAGNLLPVLNDTDGTNRAIFNRLCLLKFNNGIEQQEDKDLQLEEKLFAERDIIFSAAIDAAMHLYQNNFKFTEEVDSTICLNEYMETQQALPSFIEECCVFGENYRIHTKTIVARFKAYTKENCLPCCYSDQDISIYIASLTGVIRRKFRLNGSDPLCGFIGIGLKCNNTWQD